MGMSATGGVILGAMSARSFAHPSARPSVRHWLACSLTRQFSRPLSYSLTHPSLPARLLFHLFIYTAYWMSGKAGFGRAEPAHSIRQKSHSLLLHTCSCSSSGCGTCPPFCC